MMTVANKSGMKYKKPLTAVKRALEPAKTGHGPVVTSESPGVKLKRALRRLETIKKK